MSANGSTRILVVEDEALIAMDLQSLLEGAGYQVLGPCNSPAAAFVVLERSEPDLALLDVNLGGTDVFGIADALAQRKVRIVFLTGHTAQRLPEPHRHRPLVAKPYLPHLLLQAIQRALVQNTAA
jgi:CheY-like chemotaxis protein